MCMCDPGVDSHVFSHHIHTLCRVLRILGSFYSQGLELWRLTSSEKVKISMSWRAKGLKIRVCSVKCHQNHERCVFERTTTPYPSVL